MAIYNEQYLKTRLDISHTGRELYTYIIHKNSSDGKKYKVGSNIKIHIFNRFWTEKESAQNIMYDVFNVDPEEYDGNIFEAEKKYESRKNDYHVSIYKLKEIDFNKSSGFINALCDSVVFEGSVANLIKKYSISIKFV